LKYRFCLGLAILLSINLNLQAADEKTLLDQDVQPGGKLFLQRVVGVVSINGESGNHVRISEFISNNYRHNHRKRENDYSRVEIRENRITLIGNHGLPVNHEIQITIPEFFSISVQNAVGDINIADITGEVVLQMAGGNADLDNIKGRLAVNTHAGDIILHGLKGRAQVATLGGNLELSDFEGNVNVNNEAGDIHITNGSGNVRVRSGSGDLVIGRLTGDSLWVHLNAGDLELQNYTGKGIFDLNYSDVSIEDMIGPLMIELNMGSMAIDRLRGQLSVRMKVGNLAVNRHVGSGRVQVGRGDVDYDWEVDEPQAGDSVKINTEVGSIYFGWDKKSNPSLTIQGSEDVEGLEILPVKINGKSTNGRQMIYTYTGGKEQAKLSTKVGRIRIYER